MAKITLGNYVSQIQKTLGQVRLTDRKNKKLNSKKTIDAIIKKLKQTKSSKKKIIFIGNGGSAAISGHMAEDYTKVAGLRAICFNDAPFLTCLGNDYSFEQIFEKAIELHADAGDILIAISSSGNSLNIRNGVLAAKKKGCYVITLSGFKPDNPLSSLGDINIYVPTSSYGVTELSHEIILHYFLDNLANLL